MDGGSKAKVSSVWGGGESMDYTICQILSKYSGVESERTVSK